MTINYVCNCKHKEKFIFMIAIDGVADCVDLFS